MYLAVEEWLLHNSTKCITNIFLNLMMQSSLVYFLLGSTTIFDAENYFKFDLPTDVSLVISRIICTVFLHLILSKEL
jgi:hypothetical protein